MELRVQLLVSDYTSESVRRATTDWVSNEGTNANLCMCVCVHACMYARRMCNSCANLQTGIRVQSFITYGS